MGLSQLFISYKQNQSILLWRPTFNLKSGVLASATWLRERHDMRSMYIVALMTSVKRSWPQERLVLKLSIIEQTHGNIVFYIIKKQTTTENLFFFFISDPVNLTARVFLKHKSKMAAEMEIAMLISPCGFN